MVATARPRLRRLRRRVLGHRRALAALCAAIATAAALQEVRPPEPARPDPIVPHLSLGTRLAADHPGRTPLPVRFPDAGMADLLEPGDRLSLLATSSAADGGASATVARDAVVLAVPAVDSGDLGVMGDGSGGRLVVLGLHPDESAAVAAAAIRTVLSFSWDG